MTIFSTEEGVRVIVDGEIIEVEELTVEKVKEIARGRGIKKFVVKKEGVELSTSDFPIRSGEVVIEPFYEAK